MTAGPDTTWIDDLCERYGTTLFRIPVDFQVGDGWREIVTTLCENLEALHLKRLRVTQIKEKFGILRVYLDGADETACALVRMAEERSSTVCEWCGAPGRTHNDRWMRTVCDICNARYLKQQAQYD